MVSSRPGFRLAKEANGIRQRLAILRTQAELAREEGAEVPGAAVELLERNGLRLEPTRFRGERSGYQSLIASLCDGDRHRFTREFHTVEDLERYARLAE